MTDVLALDIATTTGFARGRVGDAAPSCGSVSFGKKGSSQLAICGHCYDWAVDTIKAPLPDVVAIEALLPPAVTRGKSNESHDLLAMLHGIVNAVCMKRGVYKVHRYPVQSVRAHFIDLSVCGKGEAKAMVLQKCKSLGWLEVADDDAADACAVWDYQCSLIDPIVGISRTPLFRGVAYG